MSPCPERSPRQWICRWLASVFALMPIAALAVPGYLAVTPVAGKYAAAVGLNDAGHYAVNSFGPEIPIQPASSVKPNLRAARSPH